MPTFRFDVNDAYAKRLQEAAAAAHLSVQDYIRQKVFDEKNIYTVEEAITRITCSDVFNGTEFTVPDLYSTEEWANISKGVSGVLGRNFFNHISAHPELGIRHVPQRTINRRTVYTYNKEEV